MELENITLLAAFAGGLLSFLSPCVLPLLPVFSAMLAGAAGEERRSTLYINAGCFLIGFTLVFIAMGATASLLGEWFLDHQPVIQKIGALLIIAMGAQLSGLVRLNWLEREYRPFLAKTFHGPLGALLLGVSFTVGWTPCTGPILASILLYAGGNTTVAGGSLLLLVYALGFSLPFFLLTVLFRQYLSRMRDFYQWLPRIQQAAGWILVITGVFLWLGWLQKGLGLFWSF